MAELLKFKHGLHANMKDNSPAIAAGTVYITRDERAMYVDLPPYKNADGSVVEPAKRIRIGDMRTYEYFEDLTNDLATDRSSLIQSALYFVEKKKVDGKDVVINALFKWNGSGFVQLNSTSDLVAELSGLESRVTEVERVAAANTAAINKNAEDIGTVAGNLSTLSANAATKEELTNTANSLSSDIAKKAAQSDLTALSKTVSDNAAANTAAHTSLEGAITAEANRAKGVEAEQLGKINANTQNIGANTSAISVLNGDENTTGSVKKAVKDAADKASSDLSTAVAGIESTISGINGEIDSLKLKNTNQDNEIAKKVNIKQDVANAVMVTDASGNVKAGAAVAEKLSYLSEVSSSIQGQFTAVGTRIKGVEDGVAGLVSRADGLEDQIESNDEDIKALQDAIAALGGSDDGSISEQIATAVDAEKQARESADAKHTSDIAKNAQDIAKNASDLAALTSKHDNFESSVANTYETKAHATETYETKAHATETYATKTALNNAKTAILGEANYTGTVKGAYGAAADASSAAAGALAAAQGAKSAADLAQADIDAYQTSNDAALAAVKKTADAAATKTALEAEVQRSTAKDNAHDQAIADEIARATAAEAGLDTRIDRIETFFAAADPNASDELVDTLKELQEYIASDVSGAATMAGNIQTNTQNIAGLTTRMGTAESDIDKLQADLATEVARATAAESKALSDAKAYTDGLIEWGQF
jgi:hypothetical protein